MPLDVLLLLQDFGRIFSDDETGQQQQQFLHIFLDICVHFPQKHNYHKKEHESFETARTEEQFELHESYHRGV